MTNIQKFFLLMGIGCLLSMYGAKKMVNDKKKVLLIIASDGFQPKEFADTKKVLEDNGVQVVVASDKTGVTKDAAGDGGPEVDLAVGQIKVSDYVGIFLIGGGGALTHLDTEGVYALMRKAKDAGILWGAICISPRILCAAGLLENKKITGWNGDKKLEIYIKNNCSSAKVLFDKNVVIDDKLITANGPSSAREFGQAIVDVLKKHK